MDPKPIEFTQYHNLVEKTDPQMMEALNTDFNIEIKEIEKVTSGTQNQVYKATLQSGENIFVRINRDSSILKAETLAYQKLSENGVPSPKVIDFKSKPPSIGQATMLITATPGVPLSILEKNGKDENALYEEVGKTLKKVHAIPLDGFGQVRNIDGSLRGKFNTYSEYIASIMETLNEAILFIEDKKMLTEEELRKLKNVSTEISELDLKQGYFIHGDLHKEHFFIEDGKVSGIIDLGATKSGDPRHDVAITLLYQNHEQRGSFKKGYGDTANNRVVLLYLAYVSANKTMRRAKTNRTEGAERALKVLKGALVEL